MLDFHGPTFLSWSFLELYGPLGPCLRAPGPLFLSWLTLGSLLSCLLYGPLFCSWLTLGSLLNCLLYGPLFVLVDTWFLG